MNELQTIIAACDHLKKIGSHAAILATIVRTSGSTFRSAGARLLYTKEDFCVGSISAGCLESELVESSWEKIEAHNQPLLVHYDTRSEQELLLGYGLGCKGVMDILIEKLEFRNSHFLSGASPFCFAHQTLAFLEELKRDQQSGVIATIIQPQPTIGHKFFFRFNSLTRRCEPRFSDSNHFDETSIRLKELSIFKDVSIVHQSRKSAWKNYQINEDLKVSVYFEFIDTDPSLTIFGNGHVTQPLLHLAKALGWNTQVNDITRKHDTPQKAVELLPQHLNSVVLLATHRYYDDLDILKALLQLKPAISYLGILGSKKRKDQMLAELKKGRGHEIGVNEAEAEFEQWLNPILYAPAGLALGGGEPGQIALSIIAEMQAALNGHTSRIYHLKEEVKDTD